jgi:hypothetical protein
MAAAHGRRTRPVCPKGLRMCRPVAHSVRAVARVSGSRWIDGWTEEDHMSDTYGFEKPDDWSDEDVTAYATLQSVQDDGDTGEGAAFDVPEMSDDSEGVA